VAEQTANPAPGAGTRLSRFERRPLAAMPLHAITSVHGEAGLRERLLIELAAFPATDHGRVMERLLAPARRAGLPGGWRRPLRGADHQRIQSAPGYGTNLATHVNRRVLSQRVMTGRAERTEMTLSPALMAA
jgi:hypothetical protein